MHTSPFAFRVALPFLVTVLTGCTAGAPAPGGPAPEPELAPPEGSEPARPFPAESPPALTAEPASHARWTVFVYASGDNGRSRDLARDLARMSQATLSADVKVIVLADWNAAIEDTDGAPYPSGSDWISIRGGGARETFARDAEQDFEDPAVLRNAVGRAFRDHPADRHGLIVWSRGEAGDVQDGKRAGAKPMSIPAMTHAIREGLTDAGLDGDRALDFFGFDSFAPARVEVAYAMRALAKVHVLNTATSSGSTWAYPDALSFLSQHPDATGSSFAAFEAETAAKAGFRSHAAIETPKLDDLADATWSLVRAVVEDPTALPGVLAAVDATVAHAKETGRPPSYARFLGELADEPNIGEVATAAQAARTSLAQVFVTSDPSCELGITLPLASNGSRSSNDDLETSKEWWAATGWDRLDQASAPGGGTTTTVP